ncbi:hypothetical protein PCE1_003024 [Barthelona sp. PCE]
MPDSKVMNDITEDTPLLVREAAITTDVEKPTKGASLNSSIITLCNTALGAGVLSLSYALKCAGLVNGLIMLALTAYLARTSLTFLTYCASSTKKFYYNEISEAVLKTKKARYLEIFLTLYTLGTCTGYPIIVSDMFNEILKHWVTGWIPSEHRTQIIILVAVFIFIPLSFLPKLDFLKFTSTAALFFILYLVVILVINVIINPIAPDIQLFNFDKKMWLAPPLITVAFTAHYNLPRIYEELSDRTPARMVRVINASVTLCLMTYMLAGIGGYLHFGDLTDDDILNSFGEVRPPFYIQLAQLGMGLVLCFSYPLVCFALRGSVENLALPKKYRGRMSTQMIVATIIVCVTCGIAIKVKKLSTVLGFSGSIPGMIIVFILPSIFYLKLPALDRPKGVEKLKAYFVLTMGFVFMIAGATIATLKAMNKL